MTRPLSQNVLRKLVGEWMAAGKRVVAPARTAGGKLLYGPYTGGEWKLESAGRPANSIKEFVFPRHEELFRYRLQGRQVELDGTPRPVSEQIVLGARPCDAAALPLLDRVFNWDSRDEFYNRLRAATTVVTLACPTFDEHCFCTSVGLGPQDASGADAMLYPLADGAFAIRSFTDKGRALFGTRKTATLPPAPMMEAKFDAKRVEAFVQSAFQSPFWGERSLACVGCGTCAYTCPTCHCFDIVDEGNATAGARVKNWDSCQFPLFTAHASGHNPRGAQGQRQRQRIYHKFHIYPEKFGAVLCTGCGNCSRNCPEGLGVPRLLEAIPTETAR